MFTATYKNINRFMSEIFKHTRSGKPYFEEALRIEGCMDTNIQDKYNPTPRTLPVDYSKTSPVGYGDMLLTITKKMQGKNECCPFINRHSGTI